MCQAFTPQLCPALSISRHQDVAGDLLMIYDGLLMMYDNSSFCKPDAPKLEQQYITKLMSQIKLLVQAEA
jgi:hypothetical protein